MNELDIAIVCAQLAPEWLYQRALHNAAEEQARVMKCVEAGVMGYRTGVQSDLTGDKSGSEGSGQGVETDSKRPRTSLAAS